MIPTFMANIIAIGTAFAGLMVGFGIGWLWRGYRLQRQIDSEFKKSKGKH